jgi:hypothetical protein
MRSVAALVLGSLLSGCAGYAIDYTRPKTSLLGAELTRYGLDSAQSQCVGGQLATSLSVWQLRQLQLAASSLKQGYAAPPRLTPADLLWVAKSVKAPKVGIETARVAAACGVSTASGSMRPPPPPRVASLPLPTTSGPAPATAAAWINLGAAQSGQAISVDASSLGETGSFRSGWFRLTNPGETKGSTSYLLRVDCAARTINSMAMRRYGPNGAPTASRDFGPNGEGATAIERGTVMEIAFLALCT